ncbi:probable C-5 sterol desaturase [Aspergillus udagawae]|uniref:C-5 sterol desaturase n=1 Tax=Aspergillus udagawae TaxID=91492 RepID=A0A8H3SF22_9EURO|nr:c-5 sterol desaturase [Aspergillus udagawae]GFF26618.1 probable C-5 sterol desaturase [Aspergillus udagawae]GFF58192.1 probable C-5 sterol desaturase [Aspergillus udagawae]GFF58438.1 probable C-5 sterol desaturase [Aspergillus udagawae]GFF97408.1 probable C-5 sterol desaturase [Aspergillus udagawae]GFG19617.1 probable C-5 sterol desaturase [Aspergillus udagawae]
MDIVLEVWDTFIGDRVYSALLPVSLSSTVSLPGLTNAANSSLSLFGASKPFVYEPATQLFQLEPSKYAYLSAWPRNNIYRQFLSFFLIVWIFGIIVYFISATLSYIFIWDKTTVKHPKFLKNQITMEIAQTMRSMPVMSFLTAPFLVAEVRGYAKLYDTFDEEPFPYYSILQFPLFIAFTDFCIYWIHRGLHHPLIYKSLHKPHHKWIMPSPFASHAFHPLDGWSQSVPYHVFPFIFPLQKLAYVFLFGFINLWTVMIHDGEYVANSPIINGAACHTMHHLYFNYNYGQFTTLWDRLGGSYRKPNEELFRRETKMDEAEWKRQTKEMETILKTVEGEDDRKYLSQEEAKKDL